jgi:signal transduction histidine kinase
VASQKGIELINNVDNDISVFADKNTLNLVIRNLISNGIKFTNQMGLIKVSAILKNNFVVVTFEDNGVGIPQDIIDKLFRIETHYSTEGTSKESGTGLGLLLCREIVHKFGGNIWVESELNIGSRFFISIPAKDLKNITND